MFILVAQCTDGALNIINQVNTDVKENGQLFICSNDTWFPLCSTKFDSEEAQAACRQLGYVDGSKLWFYWLCKYYNDRVSMCSKASSQYLLMVYDQCSL